MLFPDCSAVSLCHCYSPGMEQVGYVVKAISALLKVFLMATSPRRVSLLKEEMKQVVAGRIQKYFSGQSSSVIDGVACMGALPQREKWWCTEKEL